MTTPPLPHAASSYVFRLLGRGRARTGRAPGSTLDEALAALREGGRSALIEVELASGSLGRLLVQVGRLVFAQLEDKGAEKALAEIREGIEDAHLYILELSDEQIIFACAALAGIPLALGEALGTDPEYVSALLTQLSQQNFTGVVALEQGLQTLVWRFQRGRALNAVKLPERVRPGRLTQIVWQEQMLLEIGAAKSEADAAHTAAPSRQIQTTLAQSAPLGSTSAQVAPIQTSAIRYTPVYNTQVQSTKVQSTQVKSTQIRSTYVPNTSVHDTPVRNTTVQNTAVQNTSVAQTPLSSSFHQKGRGIPEDTEEVWARFRGVLYARLGSRAERVFRLMYDEFSGLPRTELIGYLTGQVERVAGSAAARAFRGGL